MFVSKTWQLSSGAIAGLPKSAELFRLHHTMSSLLGCSLNPLKWVGKDQASKQNF